MRACHAVLFLINANCETRVIPMNVETPENEQEGSTAVRILTAAGATALLTTLLVTLALAPLL